MEEKRSGSLHEGNKKSGGQAQKNSAPRSRREKEQIWLEHLKKTMTPAQYEAYVEREKKRRLMTGIGIGAGAVFPASGRIDRRTGGTQSEKARVNRTKCSGSADGGRDGRGGRLCRSRCDAWKHRLCVAALTVYQLLSGCEWQL